MKKIPFFAISFLVLSAFSGVGHALDIPDSGASYAYPLPAKIGSQLNMVYTMTGSGTAHILAYNESGNTVVDFKDVKPAGLQTSIVDLCCLAPGVYIYLFYLSYDSGSSEKLKPGKFVVVR